MNYISHFIFIILPYAYMHICILRQEKEIAGRGKKVQMLPDVIFEHGWNFSNYPQGIYYFNEKNKMIKKK